ncbi:MAG: LLM class flavin-dependent oxidoreductase [Proteobacteria bacterium]|nr:LLM class flavin-dependent oxidoreductase [Pseudomonadota bacterium]
MGERSQREHWGLERFALGLALGGAAEARDWQRQLEWVERADALGLHSVWLPEMHFAPGCTASPLLGLAAFAARTRQLRLGTTSLLLPIHSPVRLAREIALLDALSRGRVLVGLGRGFRAPLFRAFGVDAASKRDRFDAALDLILALWEGQSPDLSDSPFADGATRENDSVPAPWQDPHPPLAVAAFGPKGLEQAARRGLPYLASPLETTQTLCENLAYHREHLPAEVDPAALVVPIMRTVHVARDTAEAARAAEGLEREARRLADTRMTKALARAAAGDSQDRALVGTANQVHDQIARLREVAGIDLLIVRPATAALSETERTASLEQLGPLLESLRA